MVKDAQHQIVSPRQHAPLRHATAGGPVGDHADAKGEDFAPVRTVGVALDAGLVVLAPVMQDTVSIHGTHKVHFWQMPCAHYHNLQLAFVHGSVVHAPVLVMVPVMRQRARIFVFVQMKNAAKHAR